MKEITAPVVLSLLYLIASGAIISGVLLLSGLAWGLITGGVLVLISIALLYDPVDHESGSSRLRR